MERKPRLFIGCSTESLFIADAINENLDHSCEVTIWRNGTFNLSNNTIDSLIEKAASVDFAVFIFSPDDLSTVKKVEHKVVRDNVIFELGLFIGTIGKHRSFIVKPRNVDLHFPTDLLGVTSADYEPNRSDGDIASALNYACTLIKREINDIGLIQKINTYKAPDLDNSTVDPNLSDIDFSLLSVLISTYTSYPRGYSLWQVKDELKIQDLRVDLSVIKLERLGLIQKENDMDHNSEEYYSYKISQDGLNAILIDEQRLKSSCAPKPNDLPF